MHHTMVASWKRKATDGMAGTFSGASDVGMVASESEVENLNAKIGQLAVERDFLSEILGSISMDRRPAMVEPARPRTH